MKTTMKPYDDFLKSKVRLAKKQGFDIECDDVNPRLKDHQQAIVRWMVQGGRRACFAAFTWAKILGVILSKRMRKFIRTKVEVDKDAILARCGTKDKPTKFQRTMLPLLGIKLVQKEKFFVEPDLTKVEVQS